MIHSNTLKFLADLRENNNRDWFEKHRNRYETAKDNVMELITAVLKELVKLDESLAGIDPKKTLFRIYRDVRFSANKSPYKSHFGAAFAAGGKSSSNPGYYLHISPDDSFVAGGVWQPQAEQLAAIRQEIAYNTDEFRGILSAKAFKKYFKGMDEEDMLKNNPKGYDKEHPASDLLKYKSFTLTHEFSQQEIQAKNIDKDIVKVYQAMFPFNDFLKRATD